MLEINVVIRTIDVELIGVVQELRSGNLALEL
jgi:hypothetical protein